MRFRKWVPLISAVFMMSCFTACGGGQSASSTKIALSANGVSVEGAAISADPHDAVYLSRETINTEKNGDGGASSAQTEVSVIHITSPGTYRLFGTLEEGQIRVDLGEKAAKDEKAIVTLILDNAHLRCSAAPAVLFESVYGGSAEENAAETGANILLAEGSINTINGSHGASRWAQGAVSSRMSLNIGSEEDVVGTLSLTADQEGICVEDRLTVNGGKIRISAENNGIRMNKSDSVAEVNGGDVRISAGLGGSGGAVDTEGQLLLSGGTVVAVGGDKDPVLRGGNGVFVNGGTVVALGSPSEGLAADSEQVTMELRFDEEKELKDTIVVTDAEKNAVFAYDPAADEILSGSPRIYTAAMISCGDFREAEMYRLYLGGRAEGSSAGGVYDMSAVTAYSGGTEQAFCITEEQNESGGVLLSSGESTSPSGTAVPSRFTEFYLGSKVNTFFGIADK